MTRSELQHEFLLRYEPIHAAFTRYCSSRAFGIMATEDLVQEAVLITLEGFERIRNTEKLLGYMIGIVNNIVRNQRRRQRFSGEWDDNILQHLEAQISDPDLILDVQYLHRCIQKLPDPQKEAIVLFEISGCSIREIAEIQQCGEGAVKTRLHRARKRLRRSFEEKAPKHSLIDTFTTYISILL